MLGEAAVGGVEDEVLFVDAGGEGLGAEFFEGTEEGFGMVEAELDFGFARHGGKGYQISANEKRGAGVEE